VDSARNPAAVTALVETAAERAEAAPPALRAGSDELLIRRWLGSKPSPQTRIAYDSDIRQFRKWFARPLGQASVDDLQAYVAELGEHLSPITVARRISSLRSLFAFAHGTGYLRFNPALAVPLPRVEDTLVERILDTSQVGRILLAAPTRRDVVAAENVPVGDTPRNRVLLQLLYACGGRVSEVAHLRWRHIRRREGGALVSLHGKTGTRQVRIGEALFGALQDLRRPDDRDDDPVFRSRKGGPLTRNAIWRVVKLFAAAAGLDDASPHWLRHAHATHALRNGAELHVVQRSLGHQSLASTGRYLHVAPEESSSDFINLPVAPK
jgi:site-specific recombinase XerD